MKAKYNLRCFVRRRASSGVSCLTVCVVLAACGPVTERPKDAAAIRSNKLSRFAEALHVPSVQEKMLLVIPTSGCGPCIQEALQFTAKHENSTKLSVVVSGRSKRFRTLLVSKFGVDTSKVVFDKEALATQWNLISIYPTLFRLGEEGEIDSAALTPEAKTKVLAALEPLVD
jgi:hypothetical protein